MKSKDFEIFENDEKAQIFRNGIKKESDNIDIFTKDGIIDLFQQLNLKRTYQF